MATVFLQVVSLVHFMKNLAILSDFVQKPGAGGANSCPHAKTSKLIYRVLYLHNTKTTPGFPQIKSDSEQDRAEDVGAAGNQVDQHDFLGYDRLFNREFADWHLMRVK